MSRPSILPAHTDPGSQPLLTPPLPAQLRLWLQGASCCVEVGQRVLKHQLLAEADSEFGVAVHAPTSGHIRAIGPLPQALPDAPLLDGLQLQPDGLDEALSLPAESNWPALSALALAMRLQDMGVMGQHGPLLPLAWAAKASPLALLIINAVENEPFLQADSMLLCEQAAAVAEAMAMLGRILQPARLVLAIQQEQGAAINALRSLAADQCWQLEVIQAPYPAGDDAQLLRALARPEESGNSLCLPVAGVHAAGRAILHGEPCVSRIVTVSGAVGQPQNILALLGSPVADLLACAGQPSQQHALVHGGGLRGFALPDATIGIHQHSHCLLVRPKQPALTAQPCIRCGDCASICPSQLQPQELYWHCSRQELAQAQHWRLADCSQCGLCSAVCPSQLPLLDSFRLASQQLLLAEQQQCAADAARQRHRFRQFRLERDKQEKAQRLAERAAQQAAKLAQQAAAPTSHAEPATTAADKQAAIAAAMARAAERQQQRPAVTPSVNSSEREAAIAANRQAAIEAAMARAAARKAAQEAAKAAAADTPAMAKDEDQNKPGLNQQQQALIQAAMHRANAQKAAASSSPASLDQDKKALIAAAMARAAARKAAGDETEQDK